MSGISERNLTVTDVRVFVPTKDFELSHRFYTALGFTTVWNDGTMAMVDLGGHRLMLQDHFVRDWAENFMISIEVVSADDWYGHVSELLLSGDFGGARVAKPADQEWGARITHVWDPCGVLIHCLQWLIPDPE